MKSGLFNRIANELSDSEKLSRAIDARKPVQHRNKDGYIAPQTELQQSLASLWAEFLKVDFVGLDDNFFELGGHSLMAMQIGFQIRERFNVEFPLGSVSDDAGSQGAIGKNRAEALRTSQRG